MSQGSVFNIQRFSLQDGPGVRSTVFMKGCPLSCLWCHNPASQAPGEQFLRLETRCMACGRCSEEELLTGSVQGRGAADVEACPTGAFQAVGWEVEPSALVEELLRDRIFFDESGGGVTFSGGEPLLQAPFVSEALRLLQAEGVHTALDTCGFAPWPDLAAAAAHADLVLYDLKLMDAARHLEATGVSNVAILENLQRLAAAHSNLWVRIPVIPGLNDDAANLEATARFLEPLQGLRRVDLLPYHPAGEAKFARVGMPYALHGTPSPSHQHLESLALIFRTRGLATTLGGRP